MPIAPIQCRYKGWPLMFCSEKELRQLQELVTRRRPSTTIKGASVPKGKVDRRVILPGRKFSFLCTANIYKQCVSKVLVKSYRLPVPYR